uniref:Deacetylase sirtuin-type domain-containing protein n=1 Tax=Photinus pyralis TaxID=7054 RepID=A0A1Y1MIP3_PHOPY
MLEEKADLPTRISDANMCIALHGHLRILRCSRCQRTVEWRLHESTILAGITSACTFCTKRCERRIRLGKRPMSAGYLQPDIILLDEEHSQGETIGTITTKDLRSRRDFLLILGSSLVHHRPAQLAREIVKAVPHN